MVELLSFERVKISPLCDKFMGLNYITAENSVS